LGLAASAVAAACSGNSAGSSSKPSLQESPVGFASPTPVLQEPSTLRGWAEEFGFNIGTFLGNKESRQVEIEFREFNLGHIFSGWVYSEPKRGEFELTSLRYFGRLASEASMLTRAQLIWPADIPQWVSSGGYSRSELINIMQEHIRGVMVPYKDLVKEWWVVNETYNPPYRNNDVLYKTIGPDYVEIAFETARETDPSAILIYNDADNHSSNGVSVRVTKEIIGRLKPRGLVDAVGLQMHLDGTKPPQRADVIATMQSYGLPVVVTEFDVNIANMQGDNDSRFIQQAAVYGDMLSAAIESGVCKSFLVFGMKDSASIWETQSQLRGFSPDADALIYDDNFEPKPAYYAMLDVLRKAARP
jgi:endo-1,4-beta-xylanase